MKCDLCSNQDTARYEVEYGWVQEAVTHAANMKVTETEYRPIGVLSRNLCSACASERLRKFERWRRLGWWLGPIISVPLFLFGLWLDRSWGSGWSLLIFPVFIGFACWSIWSIVMLSMRLFDRDEAVQEAVNSDIWRSNRVRLREDLHKLEPHFIFHPNWDRSRRNIHSQLGLWHYCESGGPIYKYYVMPRDSNAVTDWIH